MPDILTFDGFQSQQGGMNSGILSTRIPEDQYTRGVNITCRNGVIATRPPFQEISFTSSVGGAVANIQTGKFQGMTTYEYDGTTYVVFAVNGSVYSVDPLLGEVFELTTVPGRLNQYVDRLHFCQVEKYLVVQDGSNVPIIAEGTAARLAVQASPDSEVPTGTCMAYLHGRLFVKSGPREFLAGDIYQPNTPGTVLKFTETQYLAGGGAFSVPADIGPITALTWAQAYGEATGEGPLLALCERGIASYLVSVSRAAWQDQPIMRIEPATNGCAAEYGIARMNEDLLFMSWRGLEDYALLNVEAAQYHRMTNLSTEVDVFEEMETSWLRPYIQMARFDDRLLYTSVGERVDALDLSSNTVDDYRFKGLVALDYAPNNGIASLGRQLKPAYDGIWTGVHPMGIVAGIFDNDERCFVMGKDDDGTNHFYELKKKQGNDNQTIPIQCKLYTRGMPFVYLADSGPTTASYYEKRIDKAFIWLRLFQDSIDLTLSVCPDYSIVFHQISEIRVDAPLYDTDDPATSGYPRASAKVKFPALSSATCQGVNGKYPLRGFDFEFLLEWAGILKISRFAVDAKANLERVSFECGLNETLLTGPTPDYFSYDLEA